MESRGGRARPHGLRLARVVYLKVREPVAVEATGRSLEWLEGNRLPEGRVLAVPRRGAITVMPPLVWQDM